MTMALSSRLTRVRARWRAARNSTGSLPAQSSGRIRMRPLRRQTVGRPQSRKWGEVSSAQWQRWPGGPSRGRGAPVAQARRAMSGDRGENAMCDQLSLSS